MATISQDNEYLITLPYPPEISPTELLSRKKSGPCLTKTANAFFVYRKAYVKELKRQGKRIKMTQISGVISYSWSREPEKIRSAYKDIADEASEMFKKINPTPEKQPVTTKPSNNPRGTTTSTASITAVKSDTATHDAAMITPNQFNMTLPQANVGNLRKSKKEIAQKFSRFQPYSIVYPPAYSYCQSPSFETIQLGNGEWVLPSFEYPFNAKLETYAAPEPFYVVSDDTSAFEQLPSELSSGATTCSPSPSSSPISSNTTYITPDSMQYYSTFESINNLDYFAVPAVPAVVAGSVNQTAYDSNTLLLQYTGDISNSENYMM
ncbi:441_t:CDS:1 [Paraglomus occultum]|uniref:441_t:CDS:1 n=1 Tax=Paraglomus occultum TaxID=144539 RepID=A0A9N8VCR0_9GLOM|nr:441_t:CDS:1 [Paraglomus occultum]